MVTNNTGTNSSSTTSYICINRYARKALYIIEKQNKSVFLHTRGRVAYHHGVGSGDYHDAAAAMRSADSASASPWRTDASVLLLDVSPPIIYLCAYLFRERRGSLL